MSETARGAEYGTDYQDQLLDQWKRNQEREANNE